MTEIFWSLGQFFLGFAGAFVLVYGYALIRGPEHISALRASFFGEEREPPECDHDWEGYIHPFGGLAG